MRCGTQTFVLLAIGFALLLPAVTACTSDTDCSGIYYCNLETAQCEETKLTSNWGWQVGLTTFILFIAAIISAAAGLGGGGVFVPLFIILLGMTPQQAVPVSQATIFAGSIINLIFNARAKHPAVKDHPLIDFDTLLVMCPMLLAGTVVGVIFNIIFPSWLLLAMLLVTLTYTSYKTGKKAIAAYKGEVQHIRLTQSQKDLVAINNQQQVPNVDHVPEHDHGIEVDRISEAAHSEIHEEHHDDEERHVEEKEEDIKRRTQLQKLMRMEIRPVQQIMLMVFMWIVVVVMSLLRGGKTSKSIVGIPFCSAGYWTVVAVLLLFLCSFTLILANRLYARIEEKRRLGWESVKGEVKWTKKSVYIYPLLSGVAGLLGGMLGIGGGMVLGPIFLEIGMESRSTSATSATAVVKLIFLQN
jgi:uncharacterized membrane protein YfcA